MTMQISDYFCSYHLNDMQERILDEMDLQKWEDGCGNSRCSQGFYAEEDEMSEHRDESTRGHFDKYVAGDR